MRRPFRVTNGIFLKHRAGQLIGLLLDIKVFLELFFEHHEHLVCDVGRWLLLQIGEAFAMKRLYDGVETDVEFFCYLN